jgi:hypothetical protein
MLRTPHVEKHFAAGIAETAAGSIAVGRGAGRS